MSVAGERERGREISAQGWGQAWGWARLGSGWGERGMGWVGLAIGVVDYAGRWVAGCCGCVERRGRGDLSRRRRRRRECRAVYTACIIPSELESHFEA
jgi:hypothetical protein